MSPVITIPTKYHWDPKPLKAAAKRLKVSQKMLAKERGCHYVTICRVFKGKAASPEILEWLCERLEVERDLVIKSPVGLSQKNLSAV